MSGIVNFKCGYPGLQVLKKVTFVMARTKDPLALACNALIIRWTQFRLVYGFPLVRILPQPLHTIEKERKPEIHITPNWPGRIWYTDTRRRWHLAFSKQT